MKKGKRSALGRKKKKKKPSVLKDIEKRGKCDYL